MSEYVEWFVNREKQRKGFLKMLARETPKQIMMVDAPTEMGKTWLIQRLRHECQVRGVPVAHFDFRDRLPWDYLTILRQVRDQVGAAYFNPMTEVINNATGINIQLSTENIAVNVDMQNSTINAAGDVAVGNVNVVVDNFQFVQADSETARRNIEIRITDTFFQCLTALIATQPVVFLFDSAEVAPQPTLAWIESNLLMRVRNEQLPNVLVIMAGQTVPALDDAWRQAVARTGLDLFEVDHIREYISKRGLVDLDFDTVFRTSRGHPGLLGKMADFATVEEEEDDDWL
jgi:hypothetical protein